MTLRIVFRRAARREFDDAAGRAFYCFLVGRRAVVLHAFVKKSQRTPDRELKLARKRMKEVLHG